MRILLAGESLVLLPQRAIYWERKGTLLIADTHWGKAATLRAAAIPVPGGTTSSDLARLSSLVQITGARRMVLLGDVLHAKQGRAPKTLEAVARWRGEHPSLEVLMVRGNHDRGAGDPPGDLHFSCGEAPFLEPPFAFQHFPKRCPGSYALAGHLHPAIRLSGRGRQKASLPCFYFGMEYGILPAFGALTGAAFVRPGREDRVYAIADDEVIGVHP